MRRTIAALLAAAVLATAFAGTAAAVPPKHVGKTSFVTTACVNGSNQMVIRSSWANATIDPNQQLTMTWTLNGKGLPASPVGETFVGPCTDPSFAEAAFDTLRSDTGIVAWNSWSTIDTSATGAINDTAKTIRQPGGGWHAC